MLHDTRERRALIADLFGSEPGVEARGRVLRTREVAMLFQVSERAVTDWATRGRIPSIRTPGGHRRYPAEPICRLFEQAMGTPAR